MSDITPEERQRIYREEKARLEARQEPQPPERSAFGKVVVGTILLFIAIVVIGYLSEQSHTLSDSSPSPGSGARTVDQARARFYSDAISYLGVIGDEGTRVAQTMAGDGSTLASIKAVLLSARSIDNAKYENYFRSRASGGIPNGLGDIAENADEVHRRFQEAMTECLLLWEDHNTAHVIAGGQALKSSGVLANTLVMKINATQR